MQTPLTKCMPHYPYSTSHRHKPQAQCRTSKSHACSSCATMPFGCALEPQQDMSTVDARDAWRCVV
eukprot:2933601-Amphidinium_carterae.1